MRQRDVGHLWIVPEVQWKDVTRSQHLVPYRKWPWDKPFCKSCAVAMSCEGLWAGGGVLTILQQCLLQGGSRAEMAAVTTDVPPLTRSVKLSVRQGCDK